MNTTGRSWLDLALAVLGSGTGSFGLGFFVGFRWARRRPAIPGRHARRPGGDGDFTGRGRQT